MKLENKNMEIYNKNSSPFDIDNFDLDVELKAPRKIIAERGKKWKLLIKRTGDSGDASYLIFLGELLEILDDGNPCGFKCWRYDGPDMSGGYDIKWSLFTGNLSIYRELKCGIKESLQGLDYEADLTRIAGFAEGKGIDWNGSTGGVLSMTLRLINVGEGIEALIKSLAESMFHESVLTRTMVA